MVNGTSEMMRRLLMVRDRRGDGAGFVVRSVKRNGRETAQSLEDDEEMPFTSSAIC